MDYACTGLTSVRKSLHANCYCKCDCCGGSPDSIQHQQYFAATEDATALGDLLSCKKDTDTDIRPFECAVGDHAQCSFDINFMACPHEVETAKEHGRLVKWVRSEPVQHKVTWCSQNEWVYGELEVEDFTAWLKDTYQEYSQAAQLNIQIAETANAAIT